MGDAGDYWKDIKEHRQERKDEYRNGQMKEDIQKVRNVSAHIDEKNDGEHLVVTAENAKVADYWPSTKRWISRGLKGKGYDVESLLSWLKKNK